MDIFRLSNDLKLLSKSRLMANPTFIDLDAEIPRPVVSLLDEQVHPLAAKWLSAWTDSLERLAALFREFLATTLILQAAELKQPIDESLVNLVADRLGTFLDTHGIAPLLSGFTSVHLHDALRFVANHGEVQEHQFFLRRPQFGSQTIVRQAELDFLKKQSYVAAGREPLSLKLTDAGKNTLQELQVIFGHSGYAQNFQTFHIQRGFNGLDWDNVIQLLGPRFAENRQNFIEFSFIQPGMNVLEIGCGTGTLTIEGQLYSQVMPHGHVHCIEPGEDLLKRLQEKLDLRTITNVSLHTGRAEELPFADQTFDAVIGYGSFQFCEREEAMREFKRVLKPGGIISMAIPGKMRFADSYLEWFEPFFELSKRFRQNQFEKYLFSPEELKGFFKKSGLDSIKTFDSYETYIMTELGLTLQHLLVASYDLLQLIPFENQQDIIQKLKENGQIVFEKYSLAERTNYVDITFIRGTTPVQI